MEDFFFFFFSYRDRVEIQRERSNLLWTGYVQRICLGVNDHSGKKNMTSLSKFSGNIVRTERASRMACIH